MKILVTWKVITVCPKRFYFYFFYLPNIVWKIKILKIMLLLYVGTKFVYTRWFVEYWIMTHLSINGIHQHRFSSTSCGFFKRYSSKTIFCWLVFPSTLLLSKSGIFKKRYPKKTGGFVLVKRSSQYSKGGLTAVFLVSSRGQCGDEQNMKISTFGTYRVQHLQHIGPKVAPRLW